MIIIVVSKGHGMGKVQNNLISLATDLPYESAISTDFKVSGVSWLESEY